MLKYVNDIRELLITPADTEQISRKVREIIAEVRKNGDNALKKFAKEFDGAELNSFEIPIGEAEKALADTDDEFRGVLERAAENIRIFHERQKRTGYIIDRGEGVLLGQRVRPLKRAGLYVPSGTAAYPSTVLMDAIPAKTAGVGELIMVTPRPSKDILAAAKLAGVDKIFAVGGAQAIAALAYGTETVPRVDKIVGPGSIWVQTAKKLVAGDVGIDMAAGPSNVLIIADLSANPAFVAADMLAQAEHDELAAAVLVTTSAELAEIVNIEIEKRVKSLPRNEILSKSLRNSGILITGDLREAALAANVYAPEHCELCVEEPFSLLPLIENAASVFLGNYTPEVLGDYIAGANHTLPTEGGARFSSPLSVDDFLVKSQFLHYDKAAFARAAADAALFAEREGLAAHAESARVRL